MAGVNKIIQVRVSLLDIKQIGTDWWQVFIFQTFFWHKIDFYLQKIFKFFCQINETYTYFAIKFYKNIQVTFFVFLLPWKKPNIAIDLME